MAMGSLSSCSLIREEPSVESSATKRRHRCANLASSCSQVRSNPDWPSPSFDCSLLSFGVESSLGWEGSNLPLGRERKLERKEFPSSYILVLTEMSSCSLVTIHYKKFSPLFFQYKEKLLQFKQLLQDGVCNETLQMINPNEPRTDLDIS